MAKKKGEKKSIIKRFFGAIGSFFVKITAPVRRNRVWKFLRRTVLRSPFRGYFVSSWRELKKVQWPNRKTTWKLTLTVVMFSAVFAIITTSLDFGFEKLAKQIFLK
jgi:preprotein translocase SecE subunit